MSPPQNETFWRRLLQRIGYRPMTPEFRAKLIRQGHLKLEMLAQVLSTIIAGKFFHDGSHGLGTVLVVLQALHALGYGKAAEWEGPRQKYWDERKREQMRLAEGLYIASQLAFEDLKAPPPPPLPPLEPMKRGPDGK